MQYFFIIQHVNGDIQVVDLHTTSHDKANKKAMDCIRSYDMTDNSVVQHCLFRIEYDDSLGVYTAIYDEDFICERTIQAITRQDVIDYIIADVFTPLEQVLNTSSN